MTAEEFARQYAERSGVTVEWLREQNMVPKPCDCGQGSCAGWMMGPSLSRDEFMQDYAKRFGVTVEWLEEHNLAPCHCSCGDDACQGWSMIGLFALTELDGVSLGQH